MSTVKLPTYFISHGGGPWPWMREETGSAYDALADSLRAIAREVGPKPAALLVVTGHWEAPAFTVQGSPAPGMIYDYGGFPPHTYRVRYPAPGQPALAERVRGLLEGAGIPARTDGERGFDHGTFTPLAVMYPEADVPVVQLSIRRDFDPAAHLAAGRALAPLRSEGVLILGSGLSYHNLYQMGGGGKEASKRFDDWLQETVAAPPAERTERLLHWSTAPAARQAHPEEDHLLPLLVAVGAAEAERAATVYHEEAFFGAITASSFRFGAVA